MTYAPFIGTYSLNGVPHPPAMGDSAKHSKFQPLNSPTASCERPQPPNRTPRDCVPVPAQGSSSSDIGLAENHIGRSVCSDPQARESGRRAEPLRPPPQVRSHLEPLRSRRYQVGRRLQPEPALASVVDGLPPELERVSPASPSPITSILSRHLGQDSITYPSCSSKRGYGAKDRRYQGSTKRGTNWGAGTKVDTPRESSLQKLARISNIRGAQMGPEIDAFNAGVMQGV